MQITINDKDYEVPFDPAIIPLYKFIEYQERYGDKLDKELKEILKLSDKTDEEVLHKELLIDEHLDKEGIAWFTFWTGFDFDGFKEDAYTIFLLAQYRTLRLLFTHAEQTKDFPVEIEWNGEKWMIQDYKVSPKSDMTFNEVVTPKEIVRQVYSKEKGMWFAMPYLCAVFLRKPGEPFRDEMIYEGGERLSLFRELPLQYAMNIAFFLNRFATGLKNISAFSQRMGVVPSLN